MRSAEYWATRSDERLTHASARVVDEHLSSYRQGGLSWLANWGNQMNLRNVCRIGLLPLALGALACSDMDPGTDTFEIRYPALAQGGSGGDEPSGNAGTSGAGGTENEMPLDQDDWGCLSTGITMPQMQPSRITYQVVVVDFDAQPRALTPVPDLTVEVCSTYECDRVLPACEAGVDPSPTQQCTIIGTGPAPFIYLINLPFGLVNAGLKMTAPGYVQMNYLFGGPMIGTPEGSRTVVGIPIPLLTEARRQAVYRQVGLDQVDMARGSLAVRTLTCARAPATVNPAMPPPPQGQYAASILVQTETELEFPAVSWILSDGNQFTDDLLLTNERGVAGILNVAPQAVFVKAILPNGQEYGSTTLPVLPNIITLAELRPGINSWGQ